MPLKGSLKREGSVTALNSLTKSSGSQCISCFFCTCQNCQILALISLLRWNRVWLWRSPLRNPTLLSLKNQYTSRKYQKARELEMGKASSDCCFFCYIKDTTNCQVWAGCSPFGEEVQLLPKMSPSQSSRMGSILRSQSAACLIKQMLVFSAPPALDCPQVAQLAPYFNTHLQNPNLAMVQSRCVRWRWGGRQLSP